MKLKKIITCYFTNTHSHHDPISIFKKNSVVVRTRTWLIAIFSSLKALSQSDNIS